LKEEAQKLVDASRLLTIEEWEQRHHAWLRSVEEVPLSKLEKQSLDRLSRQLRDAINEKKEQTVLALSPENLQAVCELELLLTDKKRELQEVKKCLEAWRKEQGGSGFDIEKSLLHQELIQQEKERFYKIKTVIDKLEKKILEITQG
jgi:hypothetical protein